MEDNDRLDDGRKPYSSEEQFEKYSELMSVERWFPPRVAPAILQTETDGVFENVIRLIEDNI